MLSRVIDPANRKMAVAFGRRLRQARQERGLGSTELAARLGLDQSTIPQYEAGRSLPSLPVLQKLARILGISLDRLCFEEYEAKDALQDKELAAALVRADQLPHRFRFLVVEFVESLVARTELERRDRDEPRERRVA
jgi:transcriptional regulator with XRE-family HTH domain